LEFFLLLFDFVSLRVRKKVIFHHFYSFFFQRSLYCLSLSVSALREQEIRGEKRDRRANETERKRRAL
jgi:hypothetical protein